MSKNEEELHFDHIVTDTLGKFQKVYKELVSDPLIFAVIGAALLIFSYFIFPGKDLK